MTITATRRTVIQGVAAAILTGGAAEPGLEPATITLDWHFTGYHAPFFVGLDRGIFRKHGIDLTVLPGNGSKNTIVAVAANNTTFGMADATALPAGILQGTEVKMFYCYQATTGFGIMFKPNAGIAKPTDLAGKAYGDFPASASYALFPAFAKKAGIAPGSVKIVNLSPATQTSALLAGQVDATFTMVNDSFINLRHKGNDLARFAYADQGLNLLSQGLLASADTLANNPGLVRRMATAFREAVALAEADPPAAAAIAKRLAPDSPDIDIQIDQMTETFAHHLTNARTVGQTPGWMAAADWADLVDLLHDYGTLKDKPAPDQLFTNDHLTA